MGVSRLKKCTHYSADFSIFSGHSRGIPRSTAFSEQRILKNDHIQRPLSTFLIVKADERRILQEGKQNSDPKK